ncbi:hypothetical protein HanRHA438_Chr17g0819141 [Helianthus annuus]|nr:hypothetical protein HanRHA438_Chr17g0819141 [Helianthus annuus]
MAENLTFTNRQIRLYANSSINIPSSSTSMSSTLTGSASRANRILTAFLLALLHFLPFYAPGITTLSSDVSLS